MESLREPVMGKLSGPFPSPESKLWCFWLYDCSNTACEHCFYEYLYHLTIIMLSALFDRQSAPDHQSWGCETAHLIWRLRQLH